MSFSRKTKFPCRDQCRASQWPTGKQQERHRDRSRRRPRSGYRYLVRKSTRKYGEGQNLLDNSDLDDALVTLEGDNLAAEVLRVEERSWDGGNHAAVAVVLATGAEAWVVEGDVAVDVLDGWGSEADQRKSEEDKLGDHVEDC